MKISIRSCGIKSYTDAVFSSFADIDPTNSHNSAHPADIDGTPSFNLQQSDDETTTVVSISEIARRHLVRLKDSASDFLGSKVTGCVITVPTDFSEAQREALIAAAKAAELEVLQIIHEPVAACLAYDARSNEVPTDKTILVVDLGGTRCDAAVVSSRGGMYTIIATAHDYELGGLQLDNVLVDHFAKEFLKKHKIDPRETPRSLARMKLEAEGTKRTLSLGTSATISIESLAGGYDFHSTVNRLRYELLSKKVFDQIVKLAENVVAKADLDLLDIDEVHPRNLFSEQVKVLISNRSSSPVVPLIPLKSHLASPRSSLNLHLSMPRRPLPQLSTLLSFPHVVPPSRLPLLPNSTMRILSNQLTPPSPSLPTLPSPSVFASMVLRRHSKLYWRLRPLFLHAGQPSSSLPMAVMWS